ncbi:hypothetical protein NTJ56_32140 [Burkholderia contaminans]|uniref:hypothetical protein n=1 Tax=Burkholderia contaminans TaxID=488447 RepID=UPI001CF0DE89|nr:hypothetical protein [Burkholderia contaminans]MCA7916303.1 hypothetical protein [Burkholderia contaminans]UUX40317.1 hypothetical protein NTJ56_32140 [Burkholderia contaminans]
MTVFGNEKTGECNFDYRRAITRRCVSGAEKAGNDRTKIDRACGNFVADRRWRTIDATVRGNAAGLYGIIPIDKDVKLFRPSG